MNLNKGKIALTVAAAVAIMAVVEVAMHNLMVSTALQIEDLMEQRAEALRQKDDLEASRALLLSPQHLELLGEQLGLQPLPIERFMVVELSGGGS